MRSNLPFRTALVLGKIRLPNNMQVNQPAACPMLAYAVHNIRKCLRQAWQLGQTQPLRSQPQRRQRMWENIVSRSWLAVRLFRLFR